MKNWILLIPLILLEIGSMLNAQSTIRGVVKDSLANPIPYLQVLLNQDGKVVNLAFTNDLGYYQIFGVQSGIYDIAVGGTPTCSNTYTTKGIYVPNSETKFIDFTINCSSELLEKEEKYIPPMLYIENNVINDSKLKKQKIGVRPYKYKYDGLGGNLFVGTGFFIGNISKYVLNPCYIGMNLDFIIRNMVLQFDDYLGFCIAKKTMEFSDDKEWPKRRAAFNVMLGGNFGYIVLDSRVIRIVPIVGVGFEAIMAPGYSPFLPYYKIGCYMDLKFIKLFKKNPSFNENEDNYTCLRLSFGINPHIITPRYKPYFKGAMFYITLGMGGAVER